MSARHRVYTTTSEFPSLGTLLVGECHGNHVLRHQSWLPTRTQLETRRAQHRSGDTGMFTTCSSAYVIEHRGWPTPLPLYSPNCPSIH